MFGKKFVTLPNIQDSDRLISSIDLRIGRYFALLLGNGDWTARRTEAVQYLSCHYIERTTTEYLDLNFLHATSRVAGIDWAPVPPFFISLYDKGVRLDLEIHDGNGGNLPLATSNQTSYASLCVVAYLYCRECERKTVPKAIAQQMYSIITSPRGLSRQQDGFLKHMPTATKDALRKFSRTFMGIVLSPPDAEITIIKTRTVEYCKLARSFLEFWTASPQRLSIRMEDLGSSQRDHFRVIAPGGLFLGPFRVVDKTAENTKKHERDTKFGRTLIRMTPTRGIFYYRNAPPGDYALETQLHLRATQAVFAALIAALLMSLVMVCGAIGQFGKNHLLTTYLARKALDIDGVVSLMIAIPAIAVIFALVPGEHAIESSMLRGPRLLLCLSLVFYLCSALALAMHGYPSTVSLAWAMTIIMLFPTITVYARICFSGFRGEKIAARDAHRSLVQEISSK